jgi:hypothetical protein
MNEQHLELLTVKYICVCLANPTCHHRAVPSIANHVGLTTISHLQHAQQLRLSVSLACSESTQMAGAIP